MRMRRATVIVFSTIVGLPCLCATALHAGPSSGVAAVGDSPEWHLRGVIGSGLPVTMTLHAAGRVLSGQYYYEKRTEAYVPAAIDLSGTLSASGEVSLRESTDDAASTGSFSGTFRPAGGRMRLTGTWSDPAQKRRLRIDLITYRPDFAIDGAHIVTQTSEVEKPHPKYVIQTECPRLEAGDPGAGVAFDRAARRLVDAIDQDFRSVMTAMQDDDPPQGMSGGYEQDTHFEVASLTPRAASIAFTTYADTGGAHPNTVTHTLNVDRSTGKVLLLKSLFRPGFAYAAFLSTNCRRALHDDFQRAEGVGHIPFPEGVSAKDANFVNWTMAPQGLVIHFDRYQVAAYAEGDRDVVLPWRLVGPHLRSDGPAAPLAANGL